MAELENATATRDAIGKLNAEAILTYKTDPMEDDDVSWVSPQELCAVATRLREAVQAGSPEAETILETYEKGANGIEPIAQEFIRDLDDIITVTRCAEESGATSMTLEVNW
jgi:hypothetical protein